MGVCPYMLMVFCLALQPSATVPARNTGKVLIKKDHYDSSNESFCPTGSRIPVADETFVDKLFIRLATDPAFAHMKPVVHSRGGAGSEQPWVLVLDDFLSTTDTDNVLEKIVNGETPFHKSITASSLESGSKKYGKARLANSKRRESETFDCAG